MTVQTHELKILGHHYCECECGAMFTGTLALGKYVKTHRIPLKYPPAT